MTIEELLSARATDGVLPYGAQAEVSIAAGVSRQRVQRVAKDMGLSTRKPCWFYDRVVKFMSFVAMGEGCWLWTGPTWASGYGRSNRAIDEYAHRASYRIFHGDIPDGLLVLHSCDNPPCVNPEHLRAGTYADNARDRDGRGRDRWARARASAGIGK